MKTFLRTAFGLLDHRARVRFVVFAGASVLLAALEAVGVALMVPLVDLLLRDDEAGLSGLASVADRLFETSSRDQLAAILGLMVLAAFTVKAALSMVLLRWIVRHSLRQEARLGRKLFDCYLAAPITYHAARNSAEIQRTFNESMLLVFRRTLPWIMSSTADLFTLAAIAVAVAAVDLPLASIALAYFAFVGVGYQRWIGGRHKVAARRSHDEAITRYRQVQESLRAAKDIAILHRRRYFVEQFYRSRLDLATAQGRVIFYQLLPRQFLDLAFVTGAALMATYLFTTRSTEEALASVGVFLTASFRLVAPMSRVMGAFTIARTAEPAVLNVARELRELSAFAPDAGSDGPGERMGPTTVVLDDVRYRYGPDHPEVLAGVSLGIAPGDDVAIVGSTGAGKTTLLNVLLGLIDASAGRVDVGGRPISECRAGWQRSIGYVPQEVVLLDEPVLANVAFGVSEADVDEEQAWAALRLAQADGFVRALPEGIHTPIGELGARLSGGQRQRLGLARALYHDPTVLVLDEATSAVDAATEARIIDTIVGLRGSRTLITVSHRLSTLNHCDRIYLLDEGRIAAVGSFEELRSTQPSFARLADLSNLASSSAEGPPA